MNNEPGFPTTDDMKRQYPLFRSLIQKDFKKNHYGNFPVLVIRIGILIFLFFSLLALSMRNDTITADWSSTKLMNNILFIGIVLFLLPVHFIGSLSAETLQGTFRNISLYPVGINTITSSKLVFSILSLTSLGAITLIASLSPFLIMGIITLKTASFYILMTIMVFIAYFVMVFAGSFHANIPASKSGVQNIAGYSFGALCVSLILTYWPMRFVFTSLFKIFDPEANYLGEDRASMIAEWIAYLSPFEMAYHFSSVYVLGADIQPGFFLTIPIWILIAVRGISFGNKVYMDVFFRRV